MSSNQEKNLTNKHFDNLKEGGKKTMKLMEIAEKLVSFNTVSQESSTKPIADFISEQLERGGFLIKRYSYFNEELEKVNIIAIKGSHDISESKLAFAGHMDTVKFARKKWRADPLKLISAKSERSGVIYTGLGIADMKLFLAISIKAGSEINKKELKRPFSLIFTSDEEVGCLGAKKLIQNNIKLPDFIVIGEPTKLVPINLHKGYMYIKIEIGEKN